MPEFTDMKGRRWVLEISIGAAKRVKAQTGVDLLAAGQGKVLERLATEPVTLCNVLWVLVQAQAAPLGINDEAFGESLGGDSLDGATRAFLEALVNFSPPAQRPALQRVIAKTQEIETRLTQKVLARLTDPAMEAELERVISQTFGEPSGSSLESSASTPAP